MRGKPPRKSRHGNPRKPLQNKPFERLVFFCAASIRRNPPKLSRAGNPAPAGFRQGNVRAAKAIPHWRAYGNPHRTGLPPTPAFAPSGILKYRQTAPELRFYRENRKGNRRGCEGNRQQGFPPSMRGAGGASRPTYAQVWKWIFSLRNLPVSDSGVSAP